MDKPKFDYANWPFAPAEGFRSGANFITLSLFIERCRDPAVFTPLYSFGDKEVEDNGVWYPSARQIYLHSKGEHDAMKKLVGSFKQWQQMKQLAWFRKEWEMWDEEWKMLQAQDARETLRTHSVSSPSAAKALWDDAKKGGNGRPRKTRVKRDDTDTDDAHISRVVQLRGSQ